MPRPAPWVQPLTLTRRESRLPWSIGKGSFDLRGYTVSEVARLSGVSVRTLHHYDEVGLLKPACVGANGYRYYGEDELLRLQQILFHRELGFALEEIRQVLDAPDFDRAATLKAHRQRLIATTRRHRRLIRTIDETLAALEGATKMDEKAIYQGFDLDPKAQEGAEAWLRERFGAGVQDKIDHAKTAMRGWTKAEAADFEAELHSLEAALCKALVDGLPADSAAVQALMARHSAWVARAWGLRVPSRQAYTGLADIYLEQPGFRARYDGLRAGLAEYLASAMRTYAERALA